MTLSYAAEYKPGIRVDFNPAVDIDDWSYTQQIGEGVPLANVLLSDWKNKFPRLSVENVILYEKAQNGTWTFKNSEDL